MEVRPGYQQTEVGVIPEDWEVKRLEEIVEKFVNGGTPSTHIERYWCGDIPWITGADILDQKVSEIRRFITKEAVDNSSTNVVKKGNLLLVSRTGVGKLAIAPFDIAISQDFTGLYVRKGQVTAEYLYRNLDFNQSTLQSQNQGTSIRGITRDTLSGIQIALPSTEAEQTAIAAALSDSDALIESLEELLVKKRQIRQGAMQELLTGKKRLPGFSGEWSTRPLGDVIAHCSSGATPYRGRLDYYRGTVKWITSGELNYNIITDTIEHISEEAVRETNLRIHPAGTFLMAITGLEASGTRGACGIIGSPATTNQSCMAIYPSSELQTEYLYHYYVLHGNDLALRYCQGTKQQSYTAKLVKLLPIDLPPTVKEQTAIAAVLSDMDAEIAALEAKLAKARQVKQGMMQELLTGRTRLV
jgi:type I restriction enzyme S subunit